MVRPVKVEVIKAPPPRVDRNEMYYGADSYDWIYEPHDSFQKAQVIVPGFFNEYRQELEVGTRITCRLGKIEDGITEVELQVIKTSKQNAKVDVEVSVGSARKFTPVRHDGTATKDEEKAA